MRQRVMFALLMLVCALCAALYVLPARWMIGAIPANWPLSLIDASGTLWNGQALVALGPQGAQRTLPDPIRWQWQWAWGTAPVMTIKHPWLGGPLPITPGLGSAELGAQKLRLPATALMMAGAPFNTIEPGGDVQVSWPALRLGTRIPAGPLLQIQWNDASSARVRVRPLGTYRAALSMTDKNLIAIKIDTLKGALRIEGSGASTPTHTLQFQGTARPSPDADDATRDALAPLLGMLGRRTGDITTLQY